jgi:Na+/H+-dicarboxylate symporter
MTNRSTLTIGLGMLLGVAAGLASHAAAADPAAAREIAGLYAIASDVFLRLIKMIIAPLVFATLVSGLANMDGGRAIGRIGVRSIAWFVAASVVSLALGLAFANLLQPGAGLHLSASGHAVDTGLATAGLNLRDVVTHAFPTSLLDAMARNDVLQVVVFSLFFGLGLNALRGNARVGVLVEAIDALVPVMLRLTGYVMKAAPLGVFGAIASAVTLRGLGVLATYGKLIGCFYLGLAALWAVLLGVGALFLGRRVVALLKAVREPALIAFSTASSEAAFPRLAERLEAFGIPKRIVGFTLPLGYAFNLDGSMMYQSFAAIFIAQAFGIDMSLGEQLTMLLVLMVSSKGMASVPRGSVVVVAAVAPLFRLPLDGVVLVLAIDQLLDMGRTMTNIVGNSIATAVVARWEERAAPEPAAAGELLSAARAAEVSP